MIKIITGVRRCGKSYPMFNLFNDYLKSDRVDDDHIIKVNYYCVGCEVTIEIEDQVRNEGRYRCYRTYDSRPFDRLRDLGGFLTGCGCWYWPRSGAHRRFWVGDGRPTAAGEAFRYDWLPGGGEALRPDDGL